MCVCSCISLSLCVCVCVWTRVNIERIKSSQKQRRIMGKDLWCIIPLFLLQTLRLFGPFFLFWFGERYIFEIILVHGSGGWNGWFAFWIIALKCWWIEQNNGGRKDDDKRGEKSNLPFWGYCPVAGELVDWWCWALRFTHLYTISAGSPGGALNRDSVVGEMMFLLMLNLSSLINH